MIAKGGNVNIVLLGDFKDRLTFFGPYLSAVELEGNHLIASPDVKAYSVLVPATEPVRPLK